MKPEELQDRIEKLIAADGDHCSVCGKAFAHLGFTYIGETEKREAAIVGTCCVGKLKAVMGGSVYLAPSTREH
jgi:protein-arginine kinase activator protein McsA